MLLLSKVGQVALLLCLSTHVLSVVAQSHQTQVMPCSPPSTVCTVDNSVVSPNIACTTYAYGKGVDYGENPSNFNGWPTCAAGQHYLVTYLKIYPTNAPNNWSALSCFPSVHASPGLASLAQSLLGLCSTQHAGMQV
jgi:hypothetical protein